MKKIKSIVYGEGGFDDTKPKNNVIAIEYYTDEELVELEKIEAKEAARQTLLDRLGITEEEAKILLG